MKPKKIIIHHSAGDDSGFLDWPSIRRYHIDHNGWSDIGYHVGIERVGDGYEALFGRPLDQQGAHALGHNKDSLGVCLVGDFSIAPPPEAQLAEAVRVVKMLMRIFAIQPEAVLFHRDVNETECPGAAFPLAAFADAIRQESLPL